MNSINTDRVDSKFKDYIEITKPGINKSNLFAAFTGYWLAAGFTYFDITKLLLMLLGTCLVIAGGCVINNVYDKEIDNLMDRTINRALVKGRISQKDALIFGIFITLLGHLVLLLGINLLATILAAIAFVFYVFIYTMWLKRVSTLNTVIGGGCGAIPPLIGYASVDGILDLNALGLFLILFFWQPPHFFSLALIRKEEYRKANIPMLPVIKGIKETKKQIFIFSILLLVSSVIPYLTGQSYFYLITAIVLGVIYIVLAIQGFGYIEDEEKWAKKMFIYSLFYLTIILISILLDVVLMELIG